jgi:DNA-binding MarR family transcriptional regulator
MRENGLSVPQLLCLKALNDFSPGQTPTVAVIAEEVQLSKPTVSRILDRLAKLGLISRERDSVDRRRVFISLTAAGIERTNELPKPLHDQFLERLEQLDPLERYALLQAVERVVELMDAENLDAAPVLVADLEIAQSTSELNAIPPENEEETP